ncbi:MAG: hypothetical protein U0992_22815 [Planctomycetaceae bacterium]
MLFGRLPTPDEAAIGLSLVNTASGDALTGWTDLAHVLLETNEFVYVE